MHFGNSKYVLLLVCSIAITFDHVKCVQVCGSDLDDMLAHICPDGVSNKLKRSGTTLPNYNSIDAGNNNNFGAYSKFDFERQPLLYAMLGESASNGLLLSRRRRYGIVEECCLNSCPPSKLMEYCI